MLKYKLKENKAIICVVGLGYVGLPLALEFSKSLKVIGFDIDENKIKELNNNYSDQNLLFTNDPKEIRKADFVIIAVPTPVTKSKNPDLSYVKNASKIVSENLKKGSIVILESTVYPGVTEEIMKNILEESGLKCGEDFRIAYSPERINPGDEEHTLRIITKVVGGIDKETTEIVADLYKKVVISIFKAKNIKTAEAAKVIENIQRDLNIALMNELSLIFERIGLNTRDVIETASTKWNFHKYYPGLVGGHCIPVDPYYLVHKAEELDYHPKIILAGRDINDYMPKHIAELAIKKELREYGVEVLGYDLYVDNIEEEFKIEVIHNLKDAINIDCAIITVVHDVFRKITLDKIKEIMNDNPVLIDVRGMFDEDDAKKKGFYYKTL